MTKALKQLSVLILIATLAFNVLVAPERTVKLKPTTEHENILAMAADPGGNGGTGGGG